MSNSSKNDNINELIRTLDTGKNVEIKYKDGTANAKYTFMVIDENDQAQFYSTTSGLFVIDLKTPINNIETMEIIDDGLEDESDNDDDSEYESVDGDELEDESGYDDELEDESGYDDVDEKGFDDDHELELEEDLGESDEQRHGEEDLGDGDEEKDGEEDLGDDEITLIDEGISFKIREIERQLTTWEIPWTDNELLESITDNLMETISSKKSDDTKIYDMCFKKSKEFLAHVYQIRDKLKKTGRIELYGNNYKPILDDILDNNYTNNFITPIVYDKKKIYTENDVLLNMNDEEIQDFPQVKFIDFDKEIEVLNSLYVKYNRHKGINSNGDHIDYNEYRNYLSHGGTIRLEKIEPSDDSIAKIGQTTDESHFFDNVNDGFINDEIGLSRELEYFQTDPLPFGNNILRYCNPDKKCFSVRNNEPMDIALTSLEERYANGNEYYFKDQLSNRSISDRRMNQNGIRTCNGTNKTGDSFYAHTSNKKVFNNSDFNKSINLPPLKEILVPGEKLNIVGFHINSINETNDNFMDPIYFNNQRVLNKFKGNNKGYNLNDYIKEDHNNRKQYNNLNISNISDSLINYNDNNFVIFQSNNPDNPDNSDNSNKLKTHEFESYLQEIIPNLSEIKKIEIKKFNESNNFKDLDRILNKYHIHSGEINKFNRGEMKIKEMFLRRGEKYKSYSKYEKDKKIYILDVCDKLNKIIKYINDSKKRYLSKKYLYHNNLGKFSKILINSISKELKQIYSSEYTEKDIEKCIHFLNINHKFNITSTNKITRKLDLFGILVNYIINNNQFNNNIHNNSVSSHLFENNSNDSRIDKYLKLTNLKILKNNGIFYQNTRFDNDDFRSIHLFNNMYKNIDSNQFIHKYIREYNYLKNSEYINSEIDGIEMKEICSKYIPNWNEMSNGEKRFKLLNGPILNRLKERLDIHKTIFKEEKDKYDFYLQRCEGFKVIKIYHSLSDLKKDNYIDTIYYDKIFDTSAIDCKIVDDLFDNIEIDFTEINNKDIVKNKLIEFYPLDSKMEIGNKYTNIVQNIRRDDKQRIIKSGDYALLIDNSSRFLYKRDGNIWTILGKSEVITKSNCILELDEIKNISDISFENLLNSSEIDTNPRKLENQDYKCLYIDKEDEANAIKYTGEGETEHLDSNFQGIHIPRILLPYLINVKIIKDDFIFLQQFTKELKTERANQITASDDINDILDKYSNYFKNLKDTTTTVLENNTQLSKIPKYLRNKYLEAINTPDIDERLDQIKEIIETYGKFSYNDNGDIEGFIYWDYEDSEEILCCSHYLPICNMAWKSQAERSSILEKVVSDYKGHTDDGRVTCKICGETLDYQEKSSFEGFGKDDKPISFREKVIDTEDDQITFNSLENDAYNTILLPITKRLGLELSKEDIKFIIENSIIEFKKILNMTQFYLSEEEFHGNDNKILQKYTKGNEKLIESIKKGGNEFLENEGTITLDKIKNYPPKNEQQKLFINYVNSKVYNAIFNMNQNSNKTCIIVNYLLIILETATPEYKLNSIGDERKAKVGTTLIGNLWEEVGINYLMKILDSFRKNKQSPFWVSLGGSIINPKIKFKEKYFNKYQESFKSYYHIIEKFTKKQEYLSQSEHQLILEKESVLIWPEFRPSLILDSSMTPNNLTKVNDVLEEYKNYLSEYKQIVESTSNIIMLKRAYNRLTELENKLTVFSKMIGEEFIIKINNYLLSIKRQNFISNNPSYTSSCDFQSINSIYLNNILEENQEILDLYSTQNILTKVITKKIKNSNINNLLCFNEINDSLEKSTTWEKGRQFLHYMYINRDSFESDELYKKYLYNKILQINLIVITSRFSKSPSDIGEKRFFKNIIDQDDVEIDTENPNDVVILFTKLKEKYVNLRTLDDWEDVQLKTKAQNLINIRKIIKERNSNDEKDTELFTEIDLISGDFKHDIIKKISEETKELNIMELSEEIEKLESFLKLKNIILLNNESKSKSNHQIITQIELIKNIEKCLQKHPFNILKGNELSIFSETFLKTPQQLANLSQQNDTISKIREIYNKNFNNESDGYFENLRGYFEDSLGRNDLNYKNLGRNDLYVEIYDKKLDNILKIQNYKDTDVENEKKFRKRKLIIESINGQQMFNLKHYIQSILILFSSINEKIKYKKTFTENIDKNINMMDSLGADFKEYYIDIFNTEYDSINRQLLEIFKLEDIDDINNNLEILKNISLISEQSENIYNLLENIFIYSNSYLCNEKLKEVSILQAEFITNILQFIFSKLLDIILSSRSENQLNNTLIDEIYNFVHNIIISGEKISKTSDLEIEENIKRFKQAGNVARKKAYDELSSELQGVQKLFRRWNLGDIFSGYEEDDNLIGLQEQTDEQLDEQNENEALQMGQGDNDGNNDNEE